MMRPDSLDERLSRRRLLSRGARYAAAVPAAGLLLAACGGDDGGTTTTAAAPGTSGAAAASGAGTGGKPEAADLEYWWWAEQDAPGANAWLKEAVGAFTKEHGGGVNIVEQQTDALVANFQAAATAKSGPDLGSQWATGPILAQAWNGAIAPISQFVADDESSHWLFKEENVYGGDLWSMPIYIIGQPFVYNKKLFEQAGLDPEKPPATWDELLAACQQLKAKGITPLGLGNKDTFGGRWMFAFLAVQNLDTLDDLRQAVIGETSFTDPKHKEWMERLKELIDGEYFNDDVMSLDFGQGFDVFGSGKAAMSWGTEGAVRKWAKDLGEDAVMPAPMPQFGSGKLRGAYTATQSTSFFVTSWSGDQAFAAEFLKYLHRPEQVQRWWELTSVLPADDRFDRSLVTGALSQRLVELATTGPQIWLENWIPPQVDEQGNGPAGQMLFTGGSVDEAAETFDRAAKTWRGQQKDDLEKWKSWQQEPVVLGEAG
jgi:ABC-type glycerol-3-phosphate transport system substrate-binding protein